MVVSFVMGQRCGVGRWGGCGAGSDSVTVELQQVGAAAAPAQLPPPPNFFVRGGKQG